MDFATDVVNLLSNARNWFAVAGKIGRYDINLFLEFDKGEENLFVYKAK